VVEQPELDAAKSARLRMEMRRHIPLLVMLPLLVGLSPFRRKAEAGPSIS